MAKYYNLDEKQYKVLINNLNEKKSFEVSNLKSDLQYQYKKLNTENNNFVLAAKNLLLKNFSKLYDNEDIVIDEDANVSVTENGAYVQCWIWVDTPKSKKNKGKANEK